MQHEVRHSSWSETLQASCMHLLSCTCLDMSVTLCLCLVLGHRLGLTALPLQSPNQLPAVGIGPGTTHLPHKPRLFHLLNQQLLSMRLNSAANRCRHAAGRVPTVAAPHAKLCPAAAQAHSKLCRRRPAGCVQQHGCRVQHG